MDYNKTMEFRFPQGFFWGSATSAHQVEGDNFNDWTEWEKANAKRLAEEATLRQAQGINPWPDFILQNYSNPLQPENYISGRACDHYNRFEGDFEIAKSLGQNAHRFSIEWSRIEPEEGKFNEAEIEHYRKVILALRQRGLEPFVTLWHWTNPLWIRQIGGWENKKTVNYFCRYVEKIAQSFKDIRFWIILNEPNVYVSYGYIVGKQPPEIRNFFKAMKAFRNLLEAQKLAYSIIRQYKSLASVGITHSVICFEAQNDIFINKIINFFADFFWNFYFFKKINAFCDFIGFNYYKRKLIGFGRRNKKMEDISDLGWEIFPEGIYFLLKKFSKYRKPIFITENGIADVRDLDRAKFIKGHLKWIYKAINEGVDVRGYFYWSLLDNFEMPEIRVRGFWLRFGLVEVDYKTMERRIRPSAYQYAKICRENKIIV